ncbi:MAG: STAS domain-containing protein [Actinomycetota bacterium]|nr:STAS domain-containing protein [Actinomycetota bacterium]
MTQRRFTRPEPFAVDGRCAAAGCTVVAKGEIDLCTSPAIESELERHHHDGRALEVDLSGVTFIDSTGLSVLLRTRDRLAGQGRALRVVAPDGPALRAIELTGLQRTLGVGPGR